MTDSPQITVPPGYDLVHNNDGSVMVVRSNEALSRTLAFRVKPSRYVEMLPFIDSFPKGSITMAMHWLLDHPEVKLAMAQRVAETRQPAVPPSPTPSD